MKSPACARASRGLDNISKMLTSGHMKSWLLSSSSVGQQRWGPLGPAKKFGICFGGIFFPDFFGGGKLFFFSSVFFVLSIFLFFISTYIHTVWEIVTGWEEGEDLEYSMY